MAELEALFDEAQSLAQQSQASLIAILDRAIAGDIINRDELDETFPYPRSLEKIECGAWSALSQWIDDADIRDRDNQYHIFKLRQLIEQREGLE